MFDINKILQLFPSVGTVFPLCCDNPYADIVDGIIADDDNDNDNAADIGGFLQIFKANTF